MRRLAAIVLAGTLSVSSAFAGSSDNSAPLSAGKPAGVKEATLAGSGLLLVFGLAVVAGGIALVSSQGSGNTSSTSTTATTP